MNLTSTFHRNDLCKSVYNVEAGLIHIPYLFWSKVVVFQSFRKLGEMILDYDGVSTLSASSCEGLWHAEREFWVVSHEPRPPMLRRVTLLQERIFAIGCLQNLHYFRVNCRLC